MVAEGGYHDNSITLRTNLLAPFLLTKEFLPHMIERNHGHIVNVSSLSAYIPPASLADYAATKAGLVAFHEVSLSVSSERDHLTLLVPRSGTQTSSRQHKGPHLAGCVELYQDNTV